MHAVLVWLLKLVLFILGVAAIVIGIGLSIGAWTIAIFTGAPSWGWILVGIILVLIGIYTIRHT